MGWFDNELQFSQFLKPGRVIINKGTDIFSLLINKIQIYSEEEKTKLRMYCYCIILTIIITSNVNCDYNDATTHITAAFNFLPFITLHCTICESAAR